MHTLQDIAPSFVAMAHRIIWATAATVTPDGRPRTRVLHPVWEWDGESLVGWVATNPLSPKRADLDANPWLSLTYWDPTQDTCTADCDVEWILDDDGRRDLWDRIAGAPEPVGYDPSLIEPWTSPEVEVFGGLRLRPTRLRLMPGSLMLRGEGALLTWRG